MDTKPSFHLKQAIDEWEYPLRQSGVFTADNLAELSSHLEDSFLHCAQTGRPEQEAFERALSRMGKTERLIDLYSDLNWRLLRREYLLYSLFGVVCFLASAPLCIFLGFLLLLLLLGLGLDALALHALLWPSLLFILFAVAYLASSSILQLSKLRLSSNLHWKRAMVVVVSILGLLTLCFGSSFTMGPILALLPDDMLTAWYSFDFNAINQFVRFGISAIWAGIFIVAAIWMSQKGRGVLGSQAIIRNRQLAFGLGGLVTMVLVTLMNFSMGGFALFAIYLDISATQARLGAQWSSLLLQFLFLISYILLFLFPRAIDTKGHRHKLPIELAKLFLLVFLLFQGSTYFLHVMTEQLAHHDLSHALYFENLPWQMFVFYLIITVLPIARFYQLFRKGELITT